MKSLSIRAALDTILTSVSPLPAARVPLAACGGLTLAEEIRAREDVPYRDSAAMDGFAVRSMDLEKADAARPVRLRLLGETIAAGPESRVAVAQGSTARIMTGAVLPSGCDAVVPQEQGTVEGEEAVFTAPAPPQQYVRLAGGDVRAGATVLPRGAALTPAAVAAAAVAGCAEVTVVRRPRVALFTCGSELIGPSAEMRPGLVRDANGPLLAELVRAAGCEPLALGPVGDDRAALKERIEVARHADAVIAAGGISVGARDLVRPAFEAEGLKLKFWGVDVKPGKPLLFGLLSGVPVFGLPAKPVSAFVTFEVFVRPALRRLLGHERLFRPVVNASVMQEIRREPGRPEFLRVRLARRDDWYEARLTRAEQDAHLVTSLLDADGLLFVEGDTVLVPAGERLACMLLAGGGEEAEWPLVGPQG